jgi:hypothetical protein
VNKRWAAVGVAVGMVGGGVAGFVATSGSSVGAEAVPELVRRATQSTETTTPSTDSGASTEPSRGDRLAEILAPLVEAGTITQAQADAVITAIQDAAPVGRHGGPGRDGTGRGGEQLESIVSSLGLTMDEVLTALRDGTSIAELAEQQGVEVSTIIDAAVAAVKTHLDEHVAAGDRSQAEADALLARAAEAITAFVNGEATFPFGGPGGRMGRHGGHHGSDRTAESATTTTVG